jgi:hypothetical protein
MTIESEMISKNRRILWQVIVEGISHRFSNILYYRGARISQHLL